MTSIRRAEMTGRQTSMTPADDLAIRRVLEAAELLAITMLEQLALGVSSTAPWVLRLPSATCGGRRLRHMPWNLSVLCACSNLGGLT